jgi:hypothetical protein
MQIGIYFGLGIVEILIAYLENLHIQDEDPKSLTEKLDSDEEVSKIILLL